MERGEFKVQTPLLDMRVRRLERSMARQTGGLVFAALLVSGAILRGTDPGLGNLLMGGSVLALAWVMLAGRSRHSRA
jgi:hypothetical protein